MAENLQRITRAIATLVNLPGKRQFTDPEIKDFVNRAIGWSQSQMLSSPVKDLRFEVDIVVPAGVAELAIGAVSATLPDNFIIPIRLWEQRNGKWREMHMAPDHLPMNSEPTDSLNWWCFQNGKIVVPEATQNITVRLHYRGTVTQVAYPVDTISVNGLDEVIIAKASAIAAVTGGLEQASYWESVANEEMDRFIQTNMKPYQITGFRRKRRRLSVPRWRY